MRMLLIFGLVVASTNAAGVPGGLESVENLEPLQQEMVDFAFKELKGSTVAGSVECGQSNVTVENFSQQVVAGMLYHFDLVLSAGCSDAAKRCHMVVYDQSWTETREVKWDKVNCESVEEDLNEDSANEGCGGCFSKIDILDDEHYEIIDFAFSELAGSTLAADEGCQQSQLSFENFMSAVVAGAKYKFDLIVSEECFGTTKKCSMEVFDQSWTETREVLWENVVCTEVVKECIWKEVEELDTGNFKVGGFEYFDVLSPEQQVIVDFAFSELEGSTVAGKVICDQSEVSVENFSEQLVAGTNYGFDLVLSEKCTRTDDTPGTAMRCSMVVYDVPWEGTREVTWEQVSCYEEEELISGGFENFDDFEKTKTRQDKSLKLDDLEDTHQEMVLFALGKLAGSEEGKKVAGKSVICSDTAIDGIENFKTQLVAGTNYAFDLILSKACTGTAMRCSMVVYDVPWEETREVTWEKVTCTEELNSGGFENFGDFEKLDDLEDKHKEMVLFALGKLAGSEEGKIAAGGEYIICSNLEIERIENFKTQIVAGINYAFDLILSEECTRIDEDTPGTAKRCSMVVYDQSWTQTREVSWEKVTCTDL